MSFKSQMSFLETVFPPFTNREIKDIQHPANQNIRNILKKSNLYMIGARALTEFSNFQVNQDEHIISVDITVGGIVKDSGSIHITELLNISEKFGVAWDEHNIQVGSKVPNTNEFRCQAWFSPDSVYWKKSRGEPGIRGFDNHQAVCNYDLLYVGIANNQDSYERLIAKGHHIRTRILGEEPQRYPGAHLTDEILLFLFEINPLHFHIIKPEDEWEDLKTEIEIPPIIADAEKAFVSLLKPNYNTTIFKQYPKGRDGLYNSDLNCYGYAINENLTFNTEHASFKGTKSESQFDNFKDYIIVEGDNVEIHIS